MTEQQSHPDKTFYTKKFTCPLCKTRFEHFAVRKSALQIEKRDSDFHTWTKGPNPDHYAVVVCPNCWYAAFTADFDELRTWQKARFASLPNLRKEMGTQYRHSDFTQPRTLTMAQLSLTLALRWYRLRQAPANRLAEAWLRLAWLEREAGREEQERVYLKRARDLLVEAYEHTDLADSGTAIRIAYLVFDLSIRLDDLETASTWRAVLRDHKGADIGGHLKNLIKERSLELQSLRRERKQLAATV